MNHGKAPFSAAQFLRRVFLYVLGLFILALGVSVSVKSNLGISPVNSIPYVLSRATGLDQGLLVTLVFCGFVLLQIVLLRREFRWIQLLQMVCSAVFGYFVNLSNWLLSFPAPEGYPVRLLLTAVSVLLIAVGVFLYLCAELIPQPGEGLCLAIERKTGWKYGNIKVGFDCALVLSATVISYLTMGEIVGIREGTLVAMVFVGKLIGLLSKWWKAPLARFCGR